jgi:hypothetical protein
MNSFGNFKFLVEKNGSHSEMRISGCDSHPGIAQSLRRPVVGAHRQHRRRSEQADRSHALNSGRLRCSKTP